MPALAELDIPRFDYLDPDLHGDRFHETMRKLRERSWIATSDFGYFVLDREAAGFFLRSRKAVFPGVHMFDVLGISEGPLREALSNNILVLSGEQHARLRQLVHPYFTPKAADRYRPAMQGFLAGIWEGVAERERCDFVTDFAKPYPARMIATVVGAPLEDAENLHRLSNLLQSQFDAIALMTRREELEQAAVEFDAYAHELVEQRRSSPGDDLVSQLIAAEQEGDRLSDEECVSLVRDVLNGGVDTTQSELAHGIRLFAGHPDQWAMLGADTSLAPQAAEEVLRFEPVAPFTARVLLEDVEFRDVTFPRDTVVIACAWTANREAEGDEDPRRFDITAPRGAAKSLTFGAGPHFCLGANLARAELQEGFAFLAPRMPGLELDGEPVYDTITGLYGMRSLPVRWAA
ncbi:MAG: cytochrome P450 [Solirubrobacterales bacterium]